MHDDLGKAGKVCLGAIPTSKESLLTKLVNLKTAKQYVESQLDC